MSMHEVLVTRDARSEKIRWCEDAPRVLVETCIRSALDIPTSQKILCLDAKGAPVDVLTVPNKSCVRIVNLPLGHSKSSSESDAHSSAPLLPFKEAALGLSEASETDGQNDTRSNESLPPVRMHDDDSISDSELPPSSGSEVQAHEEINHATPQRPRAGGRFRSFSKALFRESTIELESQQDDRLYSDFGGAMFQKQLLRLERIDAHLSNERNWLAFVRWSFALVSVALRLLNRSLGEIGWDRYFLYVAGGILACNSLSAWLLGWARYRRTKKILMLRVEDLNDYYRSVNIGHDAYMMVLSVIGFVVAIATVSLVHL